jgi:hypothetical protein
VSRRRSSVRRRTSVPFRLTHQAQQQPPRHFLLDQPLAVLTETRVIPDRLIDREPQNQRNSRSPAGSRDGPPRVHSLKRPAHRGRRPSKGLYMLLCSVWRGLQGRSYSSYPQHIPARVEDRCPTVGWAAQRITCTELHIRLKGILYSSSPTRSSLRTWGSAPSTKPREQKTGFRAQSRCVLRGAV